MDSISLATRQKAEQESLSIQTRIKVCLRVASEIEPIILHNLRHMFPTCVSRHIDVGVS